MTRPTSSLPRFTAFLLSTFAAIAGARGDTGPPASPPPKPEEKQDPASCPAVPGAPAKPEKKPDQDPDAVHGIHPLLFAVGVDSTVVRTDDGGFTRVNTILGLSIIPARWLELSTDLRIGYADFKYHGTPGDDVTIDAALSHDGHATLTSGAKVTLLERKRVRWTLFAEYETSFGSDALNVDSATVTLGGAQLDLTDYFRQHGKFSFSWHRIAVGTGIRIETGRVSPTFSVGFERLSAAVDVDLDQEARGTIEAFGKDPSTIAKRHNLDHNTASFYPGIDIRLPYRMRLEVQGMIVPIPDGWAFGAGIRYSFRP